MSGENMDGCFQTGWHEGQTLLEEMLNVERENHLLEGFLVDPRDLVFEERVRMNCFYCSRYNSNWKCPPNLPDLNYRKMISEFDHTAMIYLRTPFTENSRDEVRLSSSVTLHLALLELERFLWERNYSTSLSFLGGSCKLCKNGCNREKCSDPQHARAPLEAIGVNVLKTCEKYGLRIGFPPKEAILRIGMILW